MSAATDSAPLPFTIPPGSPLASGWRFQLVLSLEQNGVQDVIDTIAAYAELRCRLEPCNCSLEEEAAQGNWVRKPGQPKLYGAETWQRRHRTPWHVQQEPVLRRLEINPEPKNPGGRPRKEEE